MLSNETKIKTLLHEQNLRLTNERQVLLELFSESTHMLTPNQLFDLAKAHQIKIGLTTVYRLLEALTKTGIATPFLVEGTIYYAFCGCEHHHHFVCLSCHRVFNQHESCPTFEIPDGFLVETHRLDLFGKCPSCQFSLNEGRDLS